MNDPNPKISAARLRVLIAEDEVLVRLSLASLLREQGFEVFEAVDAEEALSVLKTTSVDVVITDLHMRTPADGLRVATYVHRHCAGTAVALASAHSSPLVDERLFDAFFPKPYAPEHIVRWINSRKATPSDQGEDALQ